jgi:hypothetical protein
MGNHSMPSKTSTLRRTVTAGTIAGCSAVGIGALSTVAAPAANACFLACSTHSSSTSTSQSGGSGVTVNISQSDGKTTQSTGALSGNQISTPIGLGVLTAAGPTQTSANTSISNVSALNGSADTIVVTAFQLPVTINNNTCTGAVAVTGTPGATKCTNK